MAESSVTAQQFLHGYDDGHRLLQGSAELSSAAQKQMLIMSDLSGPSIVPGFQSYLTAYPLRPAGYAIARTWYAAERKRPGCVWTHTIVVSVEALQLLKQPEAILRCFRRPSLPLKKNEYADYVSLPADRMPTTVLESELPSVGFLQSLLGVLYGEPDKAVLIPAQSSEDHEATVLRIWAQQPLQLRGAFSFCTGSLAPRSVYDRWLDLQVVPRSGGSQYDRHTAKATIVEEGTTVRAESAPEWISVLIRDLLQEETWPASLRPFLSAFGWRADVPRAIVRPLTELYVSLSGRQEFESAGRIAETLAQRLPTPEAGARLKLSLLGRDSGDAGWSLRTFPESQKLAALALPGASNAFDPDDLEVQERATALWRENRHDAVQLLDGLRREPLTPSGVRVLRGFSSAIQDWELLELLQSSPGLCSLLFRASAELTLRPALWKAPDAVQEAALGAIPLVDEDSEQPIRLRDIVATMAGAGASCAEQAAYRFGPAFVTAILEYAGESPGWRVSGSWLRALAANRPVVLRWLEIADKPSANALLAAAAVLEIAEVDLTRVGSGVWLPLGRQLHGEPRISEARETCFLLAVALHDSQAKAGELVGLVFGPVHEWAAHDRLPYSAWRVVEPMVPALGWWRDWDRCERLRRALVDRFAQQWWDLRFFVGALDDPSALESAVQYATSFSEGISLLKRIARGARDGSIALDPLRRSILVKSG